MYSVLVIRLRSLRLLRVSGIVMRLRMFLLLITFLKASHSFRSEERFSRNAETDLVCRLLLEKKNAGYTARFARITSTARGCGCTTDRQPGEHSSHASARRTECYRLPS